MHLYKLTIQMYFNNLHFKFVHLMNVILLTNLINRTIILFIF
jgi:hypothetical protein